MAKEKRLPLDLPTGFSRSRALELGATRGQLRGQRITQLAHGRYAQLPDESLLVVGDALFRAGWITPKRLADRLSAGRRQRGIRRARTTARLLDGRAQSPPESIFRFRIIAAGLPAPEPQCEAYDAGGRIIAHVDLGWKEWKVAVEYEGRQHADEGQFAYDVDRYTSLAAAGWVVLRASHADLCGGSRRFLDLLRRTLISRGAALH